MARLESVLASLRDGRGTPHGVCGACLELVPGVTGAGLVVMTSSAVRAPVCATDETCTRLEQLQFTLGEGPIVDAFKEGGPVLASDLSAPRWERRWPAFGVDAVKVGAQAVFAFPLQVGAIRVGVLQLYRIGTGALSSEEVAEALVVAHAATMVLLDGAGDGSRPAGDGMLPYRAEVHQATGMVVAQLHVSVEEAFLRLRARAYVEDRTVEAVARDVVRRRVRFEPGRPTQGHEGDGHA